MRKPCLLNPERRRVSCFPRFLPTLAWKIAQEILLTFMLEKPFMPTHLLRFIYLFYSSGFKGLPFSLLCIILIINEIMSSAGLMGGQNPSMGGRESNHLVFQRVFQRPYFLSSLYQCCQSLKIRKGLDFGEHDSAVQICAQRSTHAENHF